MIADWMLMAAGRLEGEMQASEGVWNQTRTWCIISLVRKGKTQKWAGSGITHVIQLFVSLLDHTVMFK